MIYRLIRRTALFIKRKRKESLIQTILLFLLFSVFFSGVIMYNSTRRYQERALEEIGATLQVSHMPEIDESSLAPIDNETIQAIQNIPHVLGVDIATPSLSGPCIPLNLENVKTHTGFDPEQQPSPFFTEKEAELESSCVEVIGCSAIPLRNQFRNNQSIIIDGVFPSQDTRGVLVSSNFAELNSLSVNDIIKLKYINSEQSEAVEVRVVGIYDTSLSFEILKNNDMGVAVYKASPYNAVFADFDTASHILGRETDVYNFKVYVDSPLHLDDVQQELIKLSLDWEKYVIYNETLSVYNEYASQIDTVFSNSLRLIVITSLVGVVLFMVVYSIWNRQRIRDICILEALGEKKARIFLQYILEMSLLSLMAVLISTPVSFLVIRSLSKSLAPEFVSSNSVNTLVPFNTGEFDINLVYSVNVDIRSVLLLLAFALLIVGGTGITLLLLMKKNRLNELLKNGG